MSCVDLTPDQRRVLDLLAHGERVPGDLTPVLEELTEWGWVIRSGEVTGVGWAHTGTTSAGGLGSG